MLMYIYVLSTQRGLACFLVFVVYYGFLCDIQTATLLSPAVKKMSVRKIEARPSSKNRKIGVKNATETGRQDQEQQYKKQRRSIAPSTQPSSLQLEESTILQWKYSAVLHVVLY